MPWSRYNWLFYCPKIVTFCILMIFELFLWNHDQDLIKWWLWTQNKMLTKNSDFWLQNDHFALAVDCRSNGAFDCANWHCESWNLTRRCLTMYIGLWDLIEPLKIPNSLRTKTLILTGLRGIWTVQSLEKSWTIWRWFLTILEEYGRANFGYNMSQNTTHGFI